MQIVTTQLIKKEGLTFYYNTHLLYLMVIRYSIFIFLFLLLTSFHKEVPRYHKVPALPGDGVFSLLRRYRLDQHSCNHPQFYKLNGLKKNSGLKVGRYYTIPVFLYQFDGRTIRSSIGVNNWTVAKGIQSYNEFMLEDGFRKKGYQDNQVLWVPFHMLNCPSEDIQLPKSPLPSDGEKNLSNAEGGSRKFPIFGKEYEHVPLKSNLMRGKVFYIVGGHGGPDPGAVSKKNGKQLCEDEYAYDVSLRLTRLLVEHGATAYMITRDPDDGIRDGKYLKCDTDELVWGNKKILRSQKPRLFQRSDAINTLYEKHKKQGVTHQKVVVIHVDSRHRNEQTDLFFYYHPDSPKSKKLAQKMHQTFRKKYKVHRSNGQYHGSLTARDLHMLRETKAPSVYVELGNISHPRDQQRIMFESNRKALAQWMFEGLK
ncbi:MAG: N-acetylmuramoyl-L-alanine amidase [Saprospiraceae bacterium]|nr:N-acetylmuramoyl-L-alanine amidase [Saprospiraceae bacterium]